MWNKLGQKTLNYGAKKLGTGVVRNTFDTIDKIMNEAYGIKPLNSDENSKITAMRYCHKNPMCKPVSLWNSNDAKQIRNSNDFEYNSEKQKMMKKYVNRLSTPIK